MGEGGRRPDEGTFAATNPKIYPSSKIPHPPCRAPSPMRRRMGEGEKSLSSEKRERENIDHRAERTHRLERNTLACARSWRICFCAMSGTCADNHNRTLTKRR